MIRLPTFRHASAVAWIAVLLGAAATAFVPFWAMHHATGSWLPSVLPRLSADSRYYLTQIREVLDGHPWIGNPYIRDYADAWFPGLLLPIWTGAIPGFLGLEMNGVFAANGIAWIFVTAGLFNVLLLRLTEGDRTVSAFGAVLGVASLHNFLIRPITQVAYPVLLLFLLSLFGILERPRAPLRYLSLGLLCVFAFYLYPHLWMIAFTATGFLFLRLLWLRDWKAVRLFLLMAVGIAILCIPQIRITASLFSDPMAKVINYRSGLVESHRVLPITLLNLKYIIVMTCCLLFVWTRRGLRNAELLLLFIGSAILFAAMSNVITGKEMDFPTHPLWQGFLVNVVAACTFASAFLRSGDRRDRIVCGILACAFLFTIISRTFVSGNAFPYLKAGESADWPMQQGYARVFEFLDKHGVNDDVILSAQGIDDYLALYTTNYNFYSQRAPLQMIPSDELLDRFLLQYADEITPAFIREHVDGFMGYGPEHALWYLDAGKEQIDLIGGDAFVEKTMKRFRELSARYDGELKRYGVHYVVTDARSVSNPRIPKAATKIWNDDRFAVYELKR